MLAEPRPDILDDRYEIGSLIGRGGMGEVHRAIDHRLGREVAVKFLRADLAAQPTVRTRFEEEARSAARLTHHNVVLVLDSGEYDRCPYLVMECLSGHTLHDEIVQGPLPPERVREIAVDVLAGLGAAHELGIVHRDVKPANILLTDDGRAKLGDFGIAKSAEGLDHTQVGQVLGTPAYLAPERLSGEPATPSADLYALGVVLYEALSGEQPFRGETPVAVAHAIATTSPPSLSEGPAIDPGLRAAIDGAMVKDPAKRFQTAAEMGAALEGRLGTQQRPLPTISDAEATQVLEVVPADGSPAGSDTTSVYDQSARPELGRRWTDGPRELRLLVVAAVLLALVVLAIAAASRGGSKDESQTPTGSAPPASQPGAGPLDDAIDRLDKAIHR